MIAGNNTSLWRRCHKPTGGLLLLVVLTGFEWSGKVARQGENLNDPDPQRRAAAVRELRTFSPQLASPYLLRALQDPVPLVQIAAARALGDWSSPKVIPVLIDWLGGTEISLRKTAADVLARMRPPTAVSALIAVLGDVDQEVRLRATVALGEIGSPEVITPLVGRLQDPVPQIREQATSYLGEIGDSRALIPLIGAFSDPVPAVRIGAIQAVGNFKDSSATPALLRQLRSPTHAIKQAAVSSLGKIRAQEAIEPLIRELQFGAVEYRAKVAYALGEIAKYDLPGREQAIQSIVYSLADTSLRVAAAEALRNIGKPAVPVLLAHLRGEIPGNPSAAAELLGAAEDSRATDALLRELEKTRIPHKTVLQALARAGDRRAIPGVLGLLQNPTPPGYRADVIANIGPLLARHPDDRATDALLSLLDAPQNEIRIMAAKHLGLLRASSAVPTLLLHVSSSESPLLRNAAINALGAIGDHRAALPLVRILTSNNAVLVRSAANALSHLAAPTTIPALKKLFASTPNSSTTQYHGLRVLQAIARAHRPAKLVPLLRRLTSVPNPTTRALAMESLGLYPHAGGTEQFIKRTKSPINILRQAAFTALSFHRGNEHRLLRALQDPSDRVGAAAAHALAQAPRIPEVRPLLRAIHRGGWATAINASLAIATHAQRVPIKDLLGLLHHSSSFVRTNAIAAIHQTKATQGIKTLLVLLRTDRSWLVRKAAARALATIPNARNALVRAQNNDSNQHVREAAKAALKRSAAAPTSQKMPMTWKSFQIVDKRNANTPVPNAPYFVILPNHQVWAFYTNRYGDATKEKFPHGTFLVDSKQRAHHY